MNVRSADNVPWLLADLRRSSPLNLCEFKVNIQGIPMEGRNTNGGGAWALTEMALQDTARKTAAEESLNIVKE